MPSICSSSLSLPLSSSSLCVLVLLAAAACTATRYEEEDSAGANGANGGANGKNPPTTLVGEGADSGCPQQTAPTPATPTTPGKLRFGVAPQWYEAYEPPAKSPTNVDSVVVGDWLIENGFTETHQQKLGSILSKNKTPYMFGYILTALAKKALGDGADCDGDPNRKLCKEGAEWVRAHVDDMVVPAYREAGRRIGLVAGTKEVLIHVEPDYFQFSEKAQRTPFTRDESNATMNKLLRALRDGGCSSCRVTIDFSPWFAAEKTAWATSAADFYAGWDRSIVKYVGLTGKPFPFTESKIDNFTYKDITTQLNLPLVVIDAYTFGGGPIDVDKSWLDAASLTKAESMGVAFVFLSQKGDIAAYDDFVSKRQ